MAGVRGVCSPHALPLRLSVGQGVFALYMTLPDFVRLESDFSLGEKVFFLPFECGFAYGIRSLDCSEG